MYHTTAREGWRRAATRWPFPTITSKLPYAGAVCVGVAGPGERRDAALDLQRQLKVPLAPPVLRLPKEVDDVAVVEVFEEKRRRRLDASVEPVNPSERGDRRRRRRSRHGHCRFSARTVAVAVDSFDSSPGCRHRADQRPERAVEPTLGDDAAGDLIASGPVEGVTEKFQVNQKKPKSRDANSSQHRTDFKHKQASQKHGH